MDGLRAVAILAVVGFHVGLYGFSGGYVGVDVFFVISGFLIINQIRHDLEIGRFSILSFYSRRVLRILPPYILVLLVTCLLAPLILTTPDVHQDFLLSAALAPLMLTNVLFYLRQGYFDLAANLKPLLHTWTLSVEEQFYVLAPLLLILVFRLGHRRFGATAAIIALGVGVLSLWGAIARTSVTGSNAAFYLAHWRAWEFIAGGIIGPYVAATICRAPRLVGEVLGALGLAGIILAIAAFDARTPYPSWWAILPVAASSLVIMSITAQPRILAARFLALPWMVAIGLVSYGWYLWHWPILSFMRMSNLGEESLFASLVAGGLLAFGLACLSYRYVELPLRQWRRAGAIKRPGRIAAAGAVACLAAAIVGTLISITSLLASRSFVASRYGIDGKGVSDNGCRIIKSANLPAHCLGGRFGLLLGDSHAGALAPSFTRNFDEQGIQLVSLDGGGCDPLLFAPSERKSQPRGRCASLYGPFERVLAHSPSVPFAIINSAWSYELPGREELLITLIGQFDASRTRVLLIGPVPTFEKSSLECVIVSDRYNESRERCARSRADIERGRAGAVAMLKATGARFAGVRYVDPIGLFCDSIVCKPFNGDHVYYRDGSHLSPRGADRLLEGFEGEFRWLVGHL